MRTHWYYSVTTLKLSNKLEQIIEWSVDGLWLCVMSFLMNEIVSYAYLGIHGVDDVEGCRRLDAAGE